MAPSPIRLLLSADTRRELTSAIGAMPFGADCELLSPAESAVSPAGVNVAFISRDVTGLSTKHVLTESLEAFYAALRSSGNLQWVHTHSAGADRPIYPELRARGVQVSTSSGANADVVAQTALAGLLALSRRFPQLIAAQHARTWAPLVGAPLPPDLAGQTAIIVGWGPIGRCIAEFLRMLGVGVIAVRHGPTIDTENGVEMVEFRNWQAALPRADWLVLACPLTAQTRGLVNTEALTALPAGASIINVARGEVVVERDLIAALQGGRLAGAYLDVFEQEPLDSGSVLWTLPNVIVTPHSAGHSAGNQRRVAAIFLDNLARWHSGRALINAVS